MSDLSTESLLERVWRQSRVPISERSCSADSAIGAVTVRAVVTLVRLWSMSGEGAVRIFSFGGSRYSHLLESEKCAGCDSVEREWFLSEMIPLWSAWLRRARFCRSGLAVMETRPSFKNVMWNMQYHFFFFLLNEVDGSDFAKSAIPYLKNH